MTGTKPHPFQTPGAFEGEWLKELGFTASPTFRYLAPGVVRTLLTDDIAQFAYPAAHGIVTLGEVERCEGEHFDTWKISGILQDEAASRLPGSENTEHSQSPFVGAVIQFIVTSTGTRSSASLVVFEQLVTSERRPGVIPIHDILVEGSVYVRDLLRSLP